MAPGASKRECIRNDRVWLNFISYAFRTRNINKIKIYLCFSKNKNKKWSNRISFCPKS